MKKFISVMAIIISLFIAPATYATENPEELTFNDLGGIMLIGDSYCTGTNIDSNGGTSIERGWAQKVVDDLELNNYIIACLGGTGFVHENADGINFYKMLDEYYPGEEAAESINWIIVNAGYNDQYHSYDEIMINAEQFNKHALERYPNAKIVLGMNGWHRTNRDIQEKIVDIVTEAYRDAADYNGMYYIEESEYALEDDSYFSNDDFHPNEDGEVALAYAIKGFLLERLEALRLSSQVVPPVFNPDNLTIVVPLALICATAVVIIVYARIRYGVSEHKKSKGKSGKH